MTKIERSDGNQKASLTWHLAADIDDENSLYTVELIILSKAWPVYSFPSLITSTSFYIWSSNFHVRFLFLILHFPSFYFLLVYLHFTYVSIRGFSLIFTSHSLSSFIQFFTSCNFIFVSLKDVSLPFIQKCSLFLLIYYCFVSFVHFQGFLTIFYLFPSVSLLY